MRVFFATWCVPMPHSCSPISPTPISSKPGRWTDALDATNPDLRAFRDRGGKLLQYHGWTDSAISPAFSLDYFAAVQGKVGDTAGFYRLFMVPGLNHCAGGAGPWQVDWLGALERWVEAGEAPGLLTARHPGNGATQALRPVTK